jgi:hypothetical protein
MDSSPILILFGFLLFILVMLTAVRYTSAGLVAADSGKTTRHAKAWHKPSKQEENRRWLRFLLVIATGLAPLQAICMTLHLFKIISYQNSFPALAPTLAGVFTIALARWRSFQELGVAGRIERSGLLAALLVVNGANLAVYSNLAVTLLAISAFIALIWVLALRAGDRLLGFASLVVVIWFALYTSGVLFSLLRPVSQRMSFVLYLLDTAAGALALLLPALLLYNLLSAEQKPLVFSLRLITALLLLSIAVYWSYHGATAAAGKPYLAVAEYYPFTQLLAATVSGILLTAQLDKRQRLYGPVFATLVSMLLVMASNLGWIDTALATLQKFI